MTVPDPELEIRGRGGGGGGGRPRNFVRPSVWSKNKGGGPPGPFPGSARTFCFTTELQETRRR